MNIERRQLRPMGMGDILDEVFYLFRSRFALLAGIAAVLYVPYSILESIIGYRSLRAQHELEQATTQDPTQLYMSLVELYGFKLALFILFVFLSLLMSAALTHAISQIVLGRETSAIEAIRYIGQRFWGFAWTQILAYLIVFIPIILTLGLLVGVTSIAIVSGLPSAGGMILIGAFTILLIPMSIVTIFLAIRIVLVQPVFVVEGLSGMAAVKRSYGLVAGHWGKIFVTMLIAQVIILILSGAAGVIPQLWLQAAEAAGRSQAIPFIVSQIATTIANIAFSPIVASVLVLLYFDLRIRKEGFDLEILAEELEQRKMSAETVSP